MQVKPYTQVISFSGGVGETLRGGPIDLRKLGTVQVRRSSDIKFNEERQKYYVEFLDDNLKHLNNEMKQTLFDEYEDAVAHEVAVINNLRKSCLI